MANSTTFGLDSMASKANSIAFGPDSIAFEANSIADATDAIEFSPSAVALAANSNAVASVAYPIAKATYATAFTPDWKQTATTDAIRATQCCTGGGPWPTNLSTIENDNFSDTDV
jgi:hypothetical protein